MKGGFAEMKRKLMVLTCLLVSIFSPIAIKAEISPLSDVFVRDMYRQILKTLPKGSGADISTIIYEKWAQDVNDTKQKKSYLEKELAARQKAVRYFIDHIKPTILQAHPDFDILMEHIGSFFSP